MVLGELLSPTDLFRAQAFYIHEVIKVVVIYEDKYFVLAIFQIIMSCLRGFDNSKKLAIMSLISSLCRNHFSQKKCYWMLLAQIGLNGYPIGINSRSHLT